MDAAYYGLAAAAVVLLVWYYIVYEQAERPRAGTLEWIDRFEKPRCLLSACGKPLRPTDALWMLLPAAAATIAVFLAQSEETLYTGDLGVLLQFSIDGMTLYLSGEALCAALAAAAVYLLGKAVTGRVFAALAGALLYAVQPGFETYACVLSAGLLLLWLWAGFPAHGAGAWALLLSGSLLLGAAAFSIAMPAVLASLAATLFFVCIHRARAEARGGWYAALQIAAALVFAAVGYYGVAALLGEWEDILASPIAWLVSVFAERGELLLGWLGAPLPYDRLLRAPLVLSGVVPLFLRWYDRHAGEALFLFLWALPAAVLYVILPPMLPTVTIALVCAYLTGRLQERGHPYAAVFGALGAAAICGLRTLVVEFLFLTFQF